MLCQHCSRDVGDPVVIKEVVGSWHDNLVVEMWDEADS